MRQYLSLDLSIKPLGDRYLIVIESPPRRAETGNFTRPFSHDELTRFFERLGRFRNVRPATPALAPAPQDQGAANEPALQDMVKRLGGDLYNSLFAGDNQAIGAYLDKCLAQAYEEKKDLRIRLRLDRAAELVDLPWEYLYSKERDFLALSQQTSLVRYLQEPEEIVLPPAPKPLRMLVMVSCPADVEPLEVEQEYLRLKEALHSVIDEGALIVDRQDGQISTLQDQLRRGEYHIFHYIGHGGYEPSEDGVLLLTDAQGRSQRFSGEDLRMYLRDERTLRLVVLNACEGARTSPQDPFAGTAQGLVRAGIPAVVAMQFEITDEAAITFAQQFYSTLVEGCSVVEALADGRKAIKSRVNDLEWGAPVLYMRADAGVLFPVAAGSAPSGEEGALPVRAPAETAILGEATPGQGAPSAAGPAPSAGEPAPLWRALAQHYPFLGRYPFLGQPATWLALGGVLLVALLFATVLRPVIWPTPTATPSPTVVVATTAPSITPIAMPEINGVVDSHGDPPRVFVRTGPDPTYAPVTKVPHGDPITISGRDGTGGWLFIRTKDDYKGWMKADFATPASPTATVTPAPAETHTPTYTPAPPTATPTLPTATPTWTPTATDTPSATPSATPTPTPTCPVPVGPNLAAAWDHGELGCPKAAPVVAWSAWQPFDGGSLLWRSDTNLVLGLFQGGSWRGYNDTWPGDKKIYSRGAPPPDREAPVRGFGYLWDKYDDLYEQLGWATTHEMGFCAEVQVFERGVVVRSRTVIKCPFQGKEMRTDDQLPAYTLVIYNNGNWVSR